MHQAHISTGRPGSDADMAACILFLAGPGGVFLNSQVLYPDGGKIKFRRRRTLIADRHRHHHGPAGCDMSSFYGVQDHV